MVEEGVEYKDIKFKLDDFGKIDIEADRGSWSIGTVNDFTIRDENRGNIVKPRSLSTIRNGFSSRAVRRINLKPEIDLNLGKTETAGNLTIREYPEYTFIFDMKIDPEHRGKGGGELFMDIYKGLTLLMDKEWAGGFIGDGNTFEFLKSQGFRRAEFETWTDNQWRGKFIGGEFYTQGNYYDLPEGDRFGFTPTPADISSQHGSEVIENVSGEPWSRPREEAIIDGLGGVNQRDDNTEIVFPPRVREDIADPFWEGSWSTWFKIKRRQINYDDSAFPVLERDAPVMDRIQDPNFSIFD